MSEQILTHEYLKEHLHYSVVTGELYWRKVTGPHVKVGSVAGCLVAAGYMRIRINGKLYYAHRLAWFWVTGKWPVKEIDHKNGIRNANYWLNLREATRSQNQVNKSGHPNNTSGFKGVCRHKRNQKWYAYIDLNSERINLGFFDAIEDACAARMKAEERLHGTFSRPQS